MANVIYKKDNACLIELSSGKLRLTLTNWGASIYLLEMKTENGYDDLTLSCDNLETFMTNTGFFGATVGRTVNRIKSGKFTLNGKEYQLTVNENSNSAHGGAVSFARRIWDYEILADNKVKFSLFSPDGDEGYPGNLNTTVTYELTDSEVIISHWASADKDTLLSYTNHAYWCLGGNGVKIYDQKLTISADEYLEVDSELIPTGNIYSVKGTPFDFTEPHAIGERINDDHPALMANRGYDLSYVRKGDGPAAVLVDEASRRRLEVWSTYPDIHIYTGNFLEGEPGKNGRDYVRHDAICLEGSFFPDTVNHKNFGDGMILRADKEYNEKITFKITNY